MGTRVLRRKKEGRVNKNTEVDGGRKYLRNLTEAEAKHRGPLGHYFDFLEGIVRVC